MDPLSLVMLIGSWVIGLIAGFALIQHSLAFGVNPVGFGANLLLSGDTFFTLGNGSLTSMSKVRRSVAVFEAGTGLGFLAIVIGYLPVLYQLFSRRETHIIMLDSRAGSPPNATALLSRHRDSTHALDELLQEWERWSAEVVESHLSYPMLSYYRSQHDNQSWLVCTDGNHGFLCIGHGGYKRSANVSGKNDFLQLSPRGHRAEQGSRRQTANDDRSATDVGGICTKNES